MQSYGKKTFTFLLPISSHQIPTFTNKSKSVNIPKPTHFQNEDLMNISWNIKFCHKKKHCLSFCPPNPTPSHPIPPSIFYVESYCIYFWYRNNNKPKKMAGVDSRGLGWSCWDPSHSNPTRTYSTKLPCCCVLYMKHI